MNKPRINLFTQIRAFYSRVFDEDIELRPTHISLYFFLLNQNNRVNWIEWFKCPFDTAMAGALINSNKTYYSVLDDLQKFEFIKYRKGKNNYKAPQICIIPLKQNAETEPPTAETDIDVSVLITQLTTQLTTQVTTQLITQLTTQVSKHKDILNTGDFKIFIVKDGEEPKPNRLHKIDEWEYYNKPSDCYLKLKNDNEFKSKFNLSIMLIESELPKFQDHWIGKGENKADWLALFRNWIRNHHEFTQQKSKIGNTIPHDSDY